MNHVENYKTQKLAQILNTHEWCDCTFIVENQKIPAHKLILAYTSPVFEVMLYGKMSSSEIVIPDVKVHIFKSMLEYIYTDNLNIESVSDAWELIYISHKYFLKDLLDISVEYIEDNLCINSVVMSYEFAELYNLVDVTNKCLNAIWLHAKYVLLCSDYHMKTQSICSILKNKISLNISDTHLILGIVNWAKNKCLLQETVVSPENIYNILVDNKLEHHLEELKLTDLSVFDQDKLSEIFDLSQAIYNAYVTNEPPSYYEGRVKIPCILQSCQRRTQYKLSRCLQFTGSISITMTVAVNCECFITGFSIVTQHKPHNADGHTYNGSVNIKIVDSSSHHLLLETDKRDTSFKYDHFCDVFFSELLIFRPKTFYEIVTTYHVENNDDGELLLRFFSPNQNGPRESRIEFLDDYEGSVLNGAAWYPA